MYPLSFNGAGTAAVFGASEASYLYVRVYHLPIEPAFVTASFLVLFKSN
jgi:hypothetical protein